MKRNTIMGDETHPTITTTTSLRKFEIKEL